MMGGRRTQPDYTPDEIISILNHSSLPNVVIEGKDDIIVYRRLEDEFDGLGPSILPIGGRENILKLYERRGELIKTDNIVLIADRDVWVNSRVPDEYQWERLIFTLGYSIENEVYVDGDLERLLTKDEKNLFDADLADFLNWYAIALSRHLRDRSVSIDMHPEHFFNLDRNELIELEEGESYPTELLDDLSKNYKQKLRGKSLMALLLRRFSAPGRSPQHNSKSLFEIVAVRRGDLLESIFSKIKHLV